MSARSKGTTHDDMNLSLTGSQISTKSSVKKSSSSKQLHRPSSVSGANSTKVRVITVTIYFVTPIVQNFSGHVYCLS